MINRGSVAVYDRNFVVDNVKDRYDFYRLNNCTFLQSYITQLARIRQPKEVKFAEAGEAVVGGSDHGVVYIFGARTGIQLDVLHHGKAMMVQTIAVCLWMPSTEPSKLICSQTVDIREGNIIAVGASAGDLRHPTISLWK